MNFMKIHRLDETQDAKLIQNVKNAKFEKLIANEKRSSARQVQYTVMITNDAPLAYFWRCSSAVLALSGLSNKSYQSAWSRHTHGSLSRGLGLTMHK